MMEWELGKDEFIMVSDGGDDYLLFNEICKSVQCEQALRCSKKVRFARVAHENVIYELVGIKRSFGLLRSN